jgi:hypothetical protein
MEEENRRTIDELITRYTLEPELRDLYVEGVIAKSIFAWFFTKSDCRSVTIFEIDSVQIPSSLVYSHGLEPGNREELIVLSLELERLLEKDAEYLLCVVDTDFDLLLGRKYSSRYLLCFEYTCVDLCFCSEKPIENLFMLGIRHLPCAVETLLANFAEVLQEVFLIRAANEKLNWKMQWIGFVTCCSIESNLVVFNRDEFIKRYLNNANRSTEFGKFIDVCEEIRSVNVESFKHRIRGHDFHELLGWYISKKSGRKGNKYRDPDIVRTAIVTAANAESVIDIEPFRTLLKIYKS